MTRLYAIQRSTINFTVMDYYSDPLAVLFLEGFLAPLEYALEDFPFVADFLDPFFVAIFLLFTQEDIPNLASESRLLDDSQLRN